MQEQIRQDGFTLPPKVLSRPVSRSGDTINPSTFSMLSPVPSVRPPPAYVAVAAASQLAMDNQMQRLQDQPHHSEAAKIDEDTAIFSEPALAVVNAFLDQLLYNFLASSRSTTMAALRPAVEQVLKGKLARQAMCSADEELQELLSEGDEDELSFTQQEQDPHLGWDLETVWKRMRLRIMVYMRLGEMEDEDEERYIEEEHLGQAGDEERLSQNAGLVSWGAAIFLTSILEFIAEQCLFVASQAAYDRMSLRRNGKAYRNTEFAPKADSDQLVIQEHDVEKVALSPMLGRLWRTWRKNLRSPRSLNFQAPASSPVMQRLSTVTTPADTMRLLNESRTKPRGGQFTTTCGSGSETKYVHDRHGTAQGASAVNDDSSDMGDSVTHTLKRPRSLVLFPLINYGLPTPVSSQSVSPLLYEDDTRMQRRRSHSLPVVGPPSMVLALSTKHTKSSTVANQTLYSHTETPTSADLTPIVDNRPNAFLYASGDHAPAVKSGSYGPKDWLENDQQENRLEEARGDRPDSIVDYHRSDQNSSGISDIANANSYQRGMSVQNPWAPARVKGDQVAKDDGKNGAIQRKSPNTSVSSQAEVISMNVISHTIKEVQGDLSPQAPAHLQTAPRLQVEESHPSTVLHGRYKPEAATFAVAQVDRHATGQGLGANTIDGASDRVCVPRVPSVSSQHSRATGTAAMRSMGHAAGFIKHPGSFYDAEVGRPSVESSVPRSEISDQDFNDVVEAGVTTKPTSTPQRLREVEDMNATELKQDPSIAVAPPAALQRPIVPVTTTTNAASTNNSATPQARDTRSRAASTRSGAPSSTGSEHKALFVRPPPTNSKPSKAGLTAREPRIQTDSVRDFADFIRSTAPDRQPPPVQPFLNFGRPTSSGKAKSPSTSTRLRQTSPNSAESSLASRALQNQRTLTASPSTQRISKVPLQPRDPTNNQPSNNDLIAFLRQGPPGARVSKAASGELIDRSSRDAIASSPNRTSSAASQSLRDSVASNNSHSGLLAHSAASTSHHDPESAQAIGFQQDGRDVLRKRHRRKDPYALPDSDEEDAEELTALPRQDESLVDFLRNVDPPKLKDVQFKPDPAVHTNPTSSRLRSLGPSGVKTVRRPISPIAEMDAALSSSLQGIARPGTAGTPYSRSSSNTAALPSFLKKHSPAGVVKNDSRERFQGGSFDPAAPAPVISSWRGPQGKSLGRGEPKKSFWNRMAANG